MSNEEVAMEVAMNFYEEKKDEFVDYLVGGVIHVVRFAKPGKPVAMTVRPVV